MKRAREIVREECDRFGAHRVRLKISANDYNADLRPFAIEWLAEKDAEEAADQGRLLAAQTIIAQSSADAAWASADAAKGANRIAWFSIGLSAIAILVSAFVGIMQIYAQ